jgi:hypothetical protein
MKLFKWTKTKPNFPCLFVTRTKWKDYWTYDVWEIVRSEGGENILLAGEGYRRGALEDLNEQEYMLIEDHRMEK